MRPQLWGLGPAHPVQLPASHGAGPADSSPHFCPFRADTGLGGPSPDGQLRPLLALEAPRQDAIQRRWELALTAPLEERHPHATPDRLVPPTAADSWCLSGDFTQKTRHYNPHGTRALVKVSVFPSGLELTRRLTRAGRRAPSGAVTPAGL